MKLLILFFLLTAMFVEKSTVLANLSADNNINKVSTSSSIHGGEATTGYEDSVLPIEDGATSSSSSTTETSIFSYVSQSAIPLESITSTYYAESSAIADTSEYSTSSTDISTTTENIQSSSTSSSSTTESSTVSTTKTSAETTTESSAETRTESSAETRTESSAESRTESSAENTTEISTMTSTEISTETSTEISTQTTTETSTEISTETTTEISTETTTEISTETTTEISTETITESSPEPTAESPREPTTSSSTETTVENVTSRSTTESSTKEITENSRTTVSQTEESTYSNEGGSTTTVSQESTTYSTDDEGGVNVGLIIGIIVTLLVIGLAAVIWRAHHTGRLSWPPKNLFSSGLADSVRPQPVPLKKFPSHCNDMLDVPSKLSHEYQLLATLSVDIAGTESFNAALRPDNKYKNRYVNILPYDSTRVKLAPEGDNFYDDYINASYVKGYTNEIEYIATQGPKEETCRDFWRMVYQEPIKVIIMVTQLEEQGKPKCSKYFPNLRENIVLDDIVVRCTTELNFPIYTSRTLILTKGERKRSITHLHFREWPDFGCPATPDLMLQFCQVMRHNIILAQPGITLIHCSAGVGRTGTLIAVDILLQSIKDCKKIDIFGTVYKLRKHRMNMVQSEAQYVYIYKCVKEALEDPSYLSSENSSTTSLEPIYENIECVRLTPPSSKVVQDTVITENEVAL